MAIDKCMNDDKNKFKARNAFILKFLRRIRTKTLITRFLYVLFLMFTLSCQMKTKKNMSDRDEYVFINAVLDSISHDFIYLADNSTIAVLIEDTTQILSDKLFTSRDISAFRNQIKTISNKKWDRSSIQSLYVLQKIELDELFAHDISQGWNAFHQNYGQGFIMCSFPIFNSDKKMCIVEINYFCGSKCGGGSVTLFKKIEKKWVVIKNYAEWVS